MGNRTMCVSAGAEGDRQPIMSQYLEIQSHIHLDVSLQLFQQYIPLCSSISADLYERADSS